MEELEEKHRQEAKEAVKQQDKTRKQQEKNKTTEEELTVMQKTLRVSYEAFILDTIAKFSLLQSEPNKQVDEISEIKKAVSTTKTDCQI